jgi:hypothetical protein
MSVLDNSDVSISDAQPPRRLIDVTKRGAIVGHCGISLLGFFYISIKWLALAVYQRNIEISSKKAIVNVGLWEQPKTPLPVDHVFLTTDLLFSRSFEYNKSIQFSFRAQYPLMQ